MPTITLNKKTVEKLIGKELTKEEIEDRIPMFGTPFEGQEGEAIHIEVFPNRPDMLSEQGFARAFASFLGLKTGLREYTAKKSDYVLNVDKSVSDIRPFTACAVVKGLKFDTEKIREIVQIQEKLHITFCRKRKKAAIGIYPMEKIRFPISYFADDPDKIKFQPLEMNKELTGLQILNQHPAGKDYAHLLEGKTKFPVFKDANNQVLSMPPIINSHATGKVSENTTDVLVECTGHDENTLKVLLNILVTAMTDMGGEVYSVQINYPDKKLNTPELDTWEMALDLKYVNKLLGLELRESDVKTLLAKMGFGWNKGKAVIPCYRADILHPVDLIEDIAIAYGYENLTPEIPKVATIGQEDKFEIFKNKIRDILIGLNLLECATFNITDNDAQTTKMNTELELVELANALTVDFNVLRRWVLPSLFQVLELNRNQEYPQNIFGLGEVFSIKENKINEQVRVSVIICDKQADYTKIRQVLDYLFRMLNLKYTALDTEHGSFIPGRVARISTNKVNVAYIGEVHPQVLNNWDLEMPVAAFELNLTELFKILQNKE